jgi:IS30 family transposase
VPPDRQPQVAEIVASKLLLDWSPEQISGWLSMHYPDDERMRVSHETISHSLFVQAREFLKKEPLDYLRSRRRMRRSRHATMSGQSRGQIVDAISTRERPPEVEVVAALSRHVRKLPASLASV